MKRINLNLDSFNKIEKSTNKELNYTNIDDKTMKKPSNNLKEESNDTNIIQNLLPVNNSQKILALSIASQIIFNSLKN